MGLITTFLFALVPLVGVAWVALNGLIVTVDGLFMSLIFLTISGICGTMALFEIRKRRSNGALPAAVSAHVGAASSNHVQRGKVQSVEFFESSVGQPNKSIVTLAGAESPVTLVFEGDLRNALPVGQKVEVILRKETNFNVLLNVTYA